MKKIFAFLALISTVIILAIVGIKFYAAHEAAQYEATAVPYLKQVVPELSTWDVKVIKVLMAPQALVNTPDEKIIKIIEYLSKLGALKSFDEPKYEKLFSKAPASENRINIVSYTIAAVYEAGDASISISLLETGDSFLVYKFDINSMVLLD